MRNGLRHPVVELRQYTLQPGQRGVLIGLFDEHLVEPQEALGMPIVGQFANLDDPDQFVWVRGFADMASRDTALRTFYGGAAWKARAAQANATMIDVDNVLLLRPVNQRSGFPAPDSARPPVGASDPPPSSLVVATLYHRDRPFDDAFAHFFDRLVRPTMTDTGAPPLACLQTEYAENTFPALPVRTGVHVFVWFTRFASPEDHREHVRALARRPRWRDEVLPELSTALLGDPQCLRLAPTPRSLLR